MSNIKYCDRCGKRIGKQGINLWYEKVALCGFFPLSWYSKDFCSFKCLKAFINKEPK